MPFRRHSAVEFYINATINRSQNMHQPATSEGGLRDLHYKIHSHLKMIVCSSQMNQTNLTQVFFTFRSFF